MLTKSPFIPQLSAHSVSDSWRIITSIMVNERNNYEVRYRVGRVAHLRQLPASFHFVPCVDARCSIKDCSLFPNSIATSHFLPEWPQREPCMQSLWSQQWRRCCRPALRPSRLPARRPSLACRRAWTTSPATPPPRRAPAARSSPPWCNRSRSASVPSSAAARPRPLPSGSTRPWRWPFPALAGSSFPSASATVSSRFSFSITFFRSSDARWSLNLSWRSMD